MVTNQMEKYSTERQLEMNMAQNLKDMMLLGVD